VAVPGYRARKINAYHAVGGNEGGPERAKELARIAAEVVVPVKIDRVVVLDFGAFQDMVDMMGGVEVYVPKDMKYVDRAGGLFIDLKEGEQTLNGYQAMGFVRYRHDDSDFQRQERQRSLMLALKEQAMKKWQISPKLVDKGMGVLGNEFDARELASLALFAQRVGAENVKITMVPVRPMRGTTNLALDTDKLPKTLREAGLANGFG
jgi:LCP family protein required for cell wall assembly